jgi:hypothetical protein
METITYICRERKLFSQTTPPMHPVCNIGVNRIFGVSASNVRIANELLRM